jgi:hypothetical protein
MIVNRRFLIAFAPGLLFATTCLAQEAQSWDGIWTGVDGRIESAPIQIAIADGKVISYTLKGAPLLVQYSKVTSNSVSFGDRDHYSVKLDKIGNTTASGQFRDRYGADALTLTKEERASTKEERASHVVPIDAAPAPAQPSR